MGHIYTSQHGYEPGTNYEVATSVARDETAFEVLLHIYS